MDIKKRSVFDKLKNAPKKELFNSLTKMQIPYDYTSDNTTLAKLISKQYHARTVTDKSSQLFNKFNNICNEIFYISFFCALFLSFVLLLLYLFPKKTKFCDSHLFNSTEKLRCIRCPIFASCSEGSCTCNDNYIRINNYCIFNDDDKILVSKMIDSAYDMLKKRGGSYFCQQSDIDWMSVEELESILLKEYQNSELNISKFNIIYNKTLTYLNQDPNLLIRKVDDIQVFVSPEIKIDTNCKIQRYFNEKIDLIIIITISLIFFVIFIFFHQRSKKNNQLTSYYSGILIRQLKDKNGIQQSENQLIYNLNAASKNKGKEIWPLVKKKLQKEQHVQCFNDGFSTNYRFVNYNNNY